LRSLNTFREGGIGRRWKRRWATAGFGVVCLTVSASATEPNPLVSQYSHHFWGTEKGFPIDTVSTIAQTADGYLWIGTDKGLVRFDGLNFRRFEQASDGSLTIGPVRALLADAQGNLWILLQNTKLLRYHDGTFDFIRGEAENGVTAMALGAKGEIVLSSLTVGALAYDGKQFLAALPAPLFTDPASLLQGETPDQRNTRLSWSPGIIPDRLAVPTSAVISIAATTDGKIWLGTQDRGLLYLRGGRIYAATEDLRHMKINCLLPLENSELWVGTTEGLWRWNGTDLTRARVPSSLLHIDVLSMIRDRESNTWVGTNNGLLCFTNSGVSLSAREVPATGGPATALFEDREGNLWVGSPRGIERLRKSAFVTYPVVEAQSERSGPVYVDQEGRTWFAPVAGGLHWLEGEKRGSVTSQGLDRDVAYSIAGSRKELWVGRQRGGLTRLQYSDDSTKIQTYTETDGLAQNSVYSVYQSRDGTVWAGTLSRGVSRFDGRRFITYTSASGLASDSVASILETRDGTIWFGASNGLSSLSNGQWKTYAAKDGLPAEDVNCLFEDSSGTLWTGTSKGLAFLGSGRAQIPRNLPALLRGRILGIAEDKTGWLWIATADRVLRVQRDKMAAGTLGATDLREFGREDGLRSTEGVKRSRSVVSDPAGRVWFSLSHGLSVIDPSHLTDSSAPALTHIEGLSVDGSQMEIRDLVRIPASPKRITLTYTGLSLADPERVRFRYFLESFDRTWSEPVATREAVYTNLGAGFYRFRVVASNSDSLWNGSETSLQFEIEPLFWQTRWFRSTCVTLILLSVWSVHRYRLYHLTKQFNMRLEERISERSRIARDLHDTLLQSFHGLLFRLQAARNLFPGRPAEAIQVLDGAITKAEQAIAEGRDAIQGLRPAPTAQNDLAHLLTAMGQEIAGSQDTGRDSPNFSVTVEGARRTLSPILQNEIYRIAGEVIGNAFRHANASQIEAEIRYDDGLLRLRIRDDGKGTDPKVLKEGARAGHWGLPGIRERAKQIGARLDFWSEAGAGTEVELTVPASVAYAKSPDSSGGDGRGFRLFRKKRSHEQRS
jgi:ligand-binding sensor domain-containing protein/signal transduction histidine kinase